MQFRTYDELTPSMEVDRTLIHLASFGGAFPRRIIEIGRRRTNSLADYVGLFAVEGGRLVGQTFVLRIPYTFPGGTETVAGIAAVGTRPDRGRAGVARSILTEVHRRERDAGIRYSTLWTNRSWGAHGLYEKLGYRDIYSSPWVVHAPLTAIPRKPRGVRPARRAELGELEELHSDQAGARLGFRRIPNGYLASSVAAHDLDPGKELVVLRSAGQLRGYAHVDSNPFRSICGELVARTTADLRTLVSEVARRAGRRPFAFQHTPVTDSPRLFRGNGFSGAPMGWYVLMAQAIGRDWSARSATAEFATTDRRFLCLAGDRF